MKRLATGKTFNFQPLRKQKNRPPASSVPEYSKALINST